MRTKLSILLILICSELSIHAQDSNKSLDSLVEVITDNSEGMNSQSEDDPIFTIVEVMPEYSGGLDSLMQYLVRNIEYPSAAKKNLISGIVYVQFVVFKTGDVGNVKVIRGIGAGCDEEAVRVVKEMPKWNPGTQRGKEVNVLYTLPVRYVLMTKRQAKKAKKRKGKVDK